MIKYLEKDWASLLASVKIYYFFIQFHLSIQNLYTCYITIYLYINFYSVKPIGIFPIYVDLFFLFLAHLTNCIIGQLHTFVISAMYSSRHVVAVVSNSFLLTSISLSYFDWFLHLLLFSPHIWNQLVYFTSDAPNGVVPCLVRLTCWV